MAKFTSAERVFRALERKESDRVPHFELLIDRRVVNQILPKASYEEFIEYMDWDALMHVERDFIKEEVIGDNPKAIRDEWGVVKRYTHERAPVPVESEAPIKSEKDLANYDIPDPDDERRFEQIRQWVKRYKGERAIIAVVLDHHAVTSDIVGFTERLMTFYTNPDLVLQINKIVLEYQLRYINNAIDAGADIIWIAGDWAMNSGPVFSPEHYNKFVLPPFQSLARKAKERGVYVMKHSDGNCWPFLDSIVAAGIDCFHPVDPLAGMDIGEVKRKYGSKLCLMGNVNCATTLKSGTADEVRQETKEVMRKAGMGGGLIASSSNSIHSGVKPENYIAMVETIHRYGKYPLEDYFDNLVVPETVN
ncbi:MAG: uroporphyrinogen decarboxylase family protein [Dehalococcoidales bacterium]|jgi:uroporphyrinogen decarboxylase|nr:uroporphyrinogen decarboxylase family protein [Dehalococcoidales bacterium]